MSRHHCKNKRSDSSPYSLSVKINKTNPLFHPSIQPSIWSILIEYIITNSNSEKFSGTIQLGKIKPYETKCVKFGDYINDLAKKLGGEPGSISIKHNFEGFFPRLLVGNILKSFPSVSFTHSFYDCSSSNSKTDYWNRTDDNFFDSSSYIPLFVQDNYYTDLVLYPNFSPSEVTRQSDR